MKPLPRIFTASVAHGKAGSEPADADHGHAEAARRRRLHFREATSTQPGMILL
jgi:hypothetical protein